LKNRKPVIGITAGDPAGIGPEVALQAINSSREMPGIPLLICRKAVLEELYPHLYNDYIIISAGETVSFTENGKYLFPVDVDCPVPQPGKGSVETGRESLAYIDTAIDLWRNGKIDAVVTGPVSKAFIEKSGTPFMGHTEYIAEKIGNERPYMMMYSGDFRVLLASTHLALSEVTSYVTQERLYEVIERGYKSISSIDKGEVVLAVAGMDPHCGDEGAIGDFDKTVTVPAIERAKKNGISVDGPFAADTLFMEETWKKYNLVIAQYHDQGLIPFKMLAFDRGVNVTLGLAIIRTSVDHGTAYNIAGKGIAGYDSMIEAINVACLLNEIKQKTI
jgi:4-hydroxythreonine-4-phosphate dehydrogenase